MGNSVSSRPNKPEEPFVCGRCGSTKFHAVKPRTSHGTKIRRNCAGECQKLNRKKFPSNLYRTKKGRKLPESPAMKKRKDVCRKLWMGALKRALVQLAGGKCVKCGYSDNEAALEFDHIDASTRKFGLNRVEMPTRGLKGRVQRLLEFKKCMLLCATHHKEKTHPHLQKILQPQYVPWGL